MKILPAIDLLEGKAVRLVKGKKDAVTVFSDKPWELAQQYFDSGATMLHVVDLTGAFGDKVSSLPIIERMIACGVAMQVGGGIREMVDIDRYFDIGVSRVVIGTKAVTDPMFVEAAAAKYPSKIVVAVDSYGEQVATKAWQETSELTTRELSVRSISAGALGVLYTDIDRDGVEVGPNIERTMNLKKQVGKALVIASGGVGTLKHLSELTKTGADEVVVGRALLAGNFTYKEAFAATQ